MLEESRIWLNKIPGQTRTDWPASNPMAKLGFRVPVGAPKCSCSSRFCAADGPRAQLLTRLAESSAAPGAARSRGRVRAAISVLVAARAPGSWFALNWAGSQDLPRVSRSAAAALRLPGGVRPPPTLRRGFLGREKPKFCRIRVRPGTVQVRGPTLVGVRARGPGRRCPREAPHGKTWATGFRDKVASKLGFGANSWEEGVGLGGKEKGQVGLVLSVWTRRSGLRGSGHRE